MQPIIVINCNLLIQIKGDDCHSMLTIPSNGDVFFYYLGNYIGFDPNK